MDSPDPLAYPASMYITLLVVAIVGGVVGYLNKEAQRSWGQVFTVVLTSSFFGFMTFCLCVAKGLDTTYTLMAVGIVGFMGKRVVIDFQNMIKLRLGLPPTTNTNSADGDGTQ